MLIDKGISAGEVITLKLSSGEEVIAKLIEETVTSYKITKPLVLSMSAKGVGMIPYLFTVNPSKEININKTQVTVVAPTDKDFATQYIEGTTGIALT